LSDVSGELARRISRRQFLFGGRNSGGGGSEAGVLGTILGAAGIGVGVMALGSPGPSAQSFQDAYVRKKPSTEQIIQSQQSNQTAIVIREPVGGQTNEALERWEDENSGRYAAVARAGGAFFWENVLLPTDDPSTLSTFGIFEIFRSNDADATLIPIVYDFTTDDIVIGDFSNVFPLDPLIGTPFSKVSLGLGGGRFSIDASGNIVSSSIGTGAQVGLPSASAGSSGFPVTASHRHGFSGQFMEGGYLHTPVLAGFPKKFKRFHLKLNFTVKRLTVLAQVAPTGGSEVYGIVNAAGVTQGFTVTLGVGVTEASAIGTSNLAAGIAGSTAYYLAQISSAAVVPSEQLNMDVAYDMNV